MASFLTDGPGDVRNDGSAAYATAAQVYATLAIAGQLERLNDGLDKLRKQADEQFTWWKRVNK